MARWTAADMPSQAGRVAVVTGATSGLGAVTARELARAGAHVVLAVRNARRGEEVARGIGRGAEVVGVDLGELESVRAGAGEITRRHERVDVLVNNAGVMAPPRRHETADGFELQLGTNHLGHFALTGLLLDSLLAATAPRVVTVASAAHRMGRIEFDDLQGERGYSPWARYGQSKLANLLFCFELQRRCDAADVPLRSLAAHPGYAATGLQTAGPLMGSKGLARAAKGLALRAANLVVAQSDEQGALPSLYAATVPDLPGGTYVGPSGPGEMRGPPRPVGTSPAARDEELARRLWDVSGQLTGVGFDALAARA